MKDSRERPSLRKLARAANVSPSTVSRALSGKEGVSEETRARLIEMAEKMGIAKGDFGGNGPSLRAELAAPSPEGAWRPREFRATLIVDTRSNLGLAELSDEPFYMELIAGLYEGGQRYFATLQMVVVYDEDMLVSAVDRRADGVIWLGYNRREGYEPWVSRLSERGVPVVFCDHYVADLPCEAVLSDNVGGAFEAAQYVGRSLGHRRVSVLTQNLWSVAAFERTRGYTAGLVDAGLAPADIQVLNAEPSFDGGYKALDAVLEFGATAVLCGNDTMALGVIRRASERGVAIPGELSVVGFDDIATSARVTPALTTVRVEKRMLGMETVRRLLHRIVEQDLGVAAVADSAPAPIRTLVPTRLIRRESSAPV